MPPKRKQVENTGSKRITRSESDFRQTTITDKFKMADDEKPGRKSGLKSDEFSALMKRLDQIDNKFTNKFSELQKGFEDQLSELEVKFMRRNNEVKEEIRKTNVQVESMEETIKGLEKSMDFSSDTVSELKKSVETTIEDKLEQSELKHKHTIDEMTSNMKALQDKMIEMEKHSRKYNLLLFGIPEVNKEGQKENIYRTIKTFLKEEVGMDASCVDSLTFANAHRLKPRTHGPRAIIIKFLKFSDREMVLGQYKSVPKGKRIVTDLPTAMKEQRNRLAKTAYELRNTVKMDDRYQTRIVEEGINVVLYVRKTFTDQWKKWKI